MDLHPGETIIFEGRPSWRSILGFYVVGLVAAAVVALIVKLADATGTAVVAFIVIFAVVVAVGFLKRIGTSYTITSERLHIRRGLLSRSVQQTKLERVQNVNTEQSFFERVLQIGTVDFDTAGTDDSDFTFAGVANPDEVVTAVDRAQRAAEVGPAA
ncbi:membrane-flanked domain protein [Paraconexibacter sp. AEG42_29]|uniref:Membrane-flanked domain protein n=1 Tax=Paraconexibacter sp. AEG42_29 TaxID=2997339 RepID=A0AAU7AUH5_9ACTN